MNKIIKSILIILFTLVLIIATVNYQRRQNEKLVSPIFTEEPEVKGKICPKFESEYQRGEVSYYDESYCEKYNPSCRTASGEIFDEDLLTCACDYKYPLGTLFRFHYQGKSVDVKCNDRGGFKKYGRVADLSKEAFAKLASPKKGTLEVEFEVIRPEYEAFDRYRRNNNLRPLARSEILEGTAKLSAMSIYIGERSWSHDGYQAIISAYYQSWEWIGENLARGFYNIEDVLTAWNNSEKHRDTLLSDHFCEVGIANYEGIWVAHFGRQW